MSPDSNEAVGSQKVLRAVGFDLDGTLVDSAADIQAAANAFLEERGHGPLDLATIVSFVGNGVPVLLERVLKRVGEAAGPAEVAAALPRFNAIYGASPSALSRLYPGVEPALARLRDAGLKLGVCTNKPARPARQVLEDMGIGSYFTALVGGDSLKQRKPHPGPLRHLAGLLECEMSSLAYVGDSQVDAATAGAAGVPFLLFTEGYRHLPVDEIPRQAAFADFAKLPALLAELQGNTSPQT